MNDTLIQWPRAKYWDKAWNPWIGCEHASPACDNCYAMAMARRFGISSKPHETKSINPPRSGVVFCGNMTDLFGDWVSNGTYACDYCELIERTLGYSQKATYLWLTKRPLNLFNALATGVLHYHDEDGDYQSPFFDCDFSNQYFGITAENQEWYKKRMEWFCHKPNWASAWLSAEPLLGNINLGLEYIHPESRFKWVVVGCESGTDKRECKIEWVESIVEQCRGVSIPVFVKQLNIGGKCETDITKFPEHLQIRQVPWDVRVSR